MSATVRSGAVFIDSWRRDGVLVAKCECACGRDAVVVASFLKPGSLGCGVCSRLFRQSSERAAARRATPPRWTVDELAEWAIGPFRPADALVLA